MMNSHRTLFQHVTPSKGNPPPPTSQLPASGPTVSAFSSWSSSQSSAAASTPSSSLGAQNPPPPPPAAHHETYHPGSPRGSQGGDAVAATTTATGDVVTVSVPKVFVPIVEEMVAAMRELSQIESDINKRARYMIQRVGLATPRESTTGVVKQENAHDEDDSRPLSGMELVNRDLADCATNIQKLKDITNCVSDYAACRVQCDVVDGDVQELQRSAIAKFESVLVRTKSTVQAVIKAHEAAVFASQTTFMNARQAFSGFEGEFAEQRRNLAQSTVVKLEEMRLRMARIETKKKCELDDVQGRLSVQDEYDPETTSLRRNSTRLGGDLSQVAGQLERIGTLRCALDDALGGAEAAAALLDLSFVSSLTAVSDPPSRQSPTGASAPERLPTQARMQEHSFSAAPQLQGLITNTQAAAPVDGLRKRQRETNDQKETHGAAMRPHNKALQSNAHAPIPIADRRPSTDGAEEQQLPVVPQHRGGVTGFLKAIYDRATRFSDDEEEDADDDVAPPPRQKVRTEVRTNDVSSDDDDDDDLSDASDYNV